MQIAVRSRQSQPRIPLALQSVVDLLTCLAHALKQMQFYGFGGTGAQRALEAARVVFDDVWAESDRLHVTVRANTFEVEGQTVYTGDGLSDSLPFLFYKDGIRDLIFLPGFEREELGDFLATLGHARSIRVDDDDLVTLLWQRDLAFLRYGYVDVTADAAPIEEPQAATGNTGNADADAGASDGPLARAGGGRGATASAAAASAVPGAIVRRLSAQVLAAEAAPRDPWEDPERLRGASTPAAADRATPLILEPAEMAAIQSQIEMELVRDVVGDIVAALLDSLEDAPAPKQAEILSILAGFLPALLDERRLDLVADAVLEIDRMAADGRIASEHQEAVQQVAQGPRMAAAMEALLAALQGGEFVPSLATVTRLLARLGSVCFVALVRGAETTKSRELRGALQTAMDAVFTAHPARAYEALAGGDVVVLRAILRTMQEHADVAHVRRVAKLLYHEDATVREGAVRVVVVSGGRDGAHTLRRALADPSADVRIAALWGLGTWRVAELCSDLEARLQDKALLEISDAERMAIFEAYARIGGEAAVPLLARFLTGRAPLGRRWPSELRVCAARVLPLTESRAGKAALIKASRDDDDAVRRVAQRALQRLEQLA